jgi:putative acetyltransferase
MITIRPVQQKEIPAVKLVILTVAYNIFGFDGTFEDSIRHFEEVGEFEDMNNVKAYYENSGGRFLVVLDREQVIGSGAIRRMDRETGELKRVWMLEKYHGQGIGYRLIQQLFMFAREMGYIRIRIQTSPAQKRALDFYRKLGFYEIPCYNDERNEISMEIKLSA